MRTSHPYIVDIFTTIVANVSTELGYTVNYLYGHPVEIISQLQEMSKGTNKANRFPVVCLFQDFDEKLGAGQLTEVSLNIVIANLTDPKYVAPQRYAKNFKPYLYPIYDELLYQISNTFSVADMSMIEHTKTDRLFWGKSALYGNEGNTFSDFLDAIELTNLKLTLNQEQCQIF